MSNKNPKTRYCWELAGLLAASVLSPILAGAQVPIGPDVSIEYSGSPSVAIVTYHVESAIETDDPQPLLRIYGDGRVRVHRPWHDRAAGDYEFTMSEQEIAGLLEELHDNGVMTFDKQSVDEERRAAQLQRLNAARSGRVLLTHNSDVEITTVQVNLESYAPARSAAPVANYKKEVRCADLQNESREFPQIAALQGMARADATLRAFADDVRLRKMPKAPSP